MMVAYIDVEYYNNTYKGVDAGDDLDRYIERASDLVDQVTGYKIADLSALHPRIQELVKKATAAQVEFYVLNGGPEGPEGDQGPQGVGIEDITSDGENITFHLTDGTTRVIPWPSQGGE